MNKYHLLTFVVLLSFLAVGVSQDIKDEEKAEHLNFKLKYEKDMKFTKTITTSVKKEYTDEEGKNVSESTKEIVKTMLTIDEVNEDLPTKVKYEFVEIKKYKEDKEVKDYKDELKKHWILSKINKDLKVEVIEKSEEFPKNDDSRYFLNALEFNGFLQFSYLKRLSKKVGSKWSDSLRFNYRDEFITSPDVDVTLDSIERINGQDIAKLSLNYEDSNDIYIFYTGTIILNVPERRIVGWSFEIIFDIGEMRLEFQVGCEFNYDVKEPEKKEEEKDEVKPKNEDE